jgi:hypothetical protein
MVSTHILNKYAMLADKINLPGGKIYPGKNLRAGGGQEMPGSNGGDWLNIIRLTT